MASRNSDGTNILQTANVKRVMHTGSKIVVSDSKGDDVLERVEDTDYRPSESGSS